MTRSPSFLEFNSGDSFGTFALTTFFQYNEGNNQANQANSRYLVHPM